MPKKSQESKKRSARKSAKKSAPKSLDQKVARILAGTAGEDFILADAKDGDMGGGMSAPGRNRGADAARHPFRTYAQYLQLMRDVTEQGLVDIMLMSAGSSEQLTINERLFDSSPVTAAIRANDTTDIWLGDSGDYKNQPSLPFRTVTIDHAQCGKWHCEPKERAIGADLGLYSITFNNDARLDSDALQAYKAFRIEAEQKAFRHFLEVFVPNAPGQRAPADVGRYVNDAIAKTLAAVTSVGRPLFLKMPYFGPAATEQLVRYDSSIIVGILGGPAGTTHDSYRMLWEAKKYGARAALFGRKINNAEDQLSTVKILRAIADGELGAEEAVRAYHGELQKLGIKPDRSLEDDLVLTQVA